jgi:hypothetical protein
MMDPKARGSEDHASLRLYQIIFISGVDTPGSTSRNL